MHWIIKLSDTGYRISKQNVNIGYPRRQFLQIRYPTGFRENGFEKKKYKKDIKKKIYKKNIKKRLKNI